MSTFVRQPFRLAPSVPCGLCVRSLLYDAVMVLVAKELRAAGGPLPLHDLAVAVQKTLNVSARPALHPWVAV